MKAEKEFEMSAISSVVRNENSAIPAGKSRGSSETLNKALTVFKGALIVSVVLYVTITWALQAVARFN